MGRWACGAAALAVALSPLTARAQTGAEAEVLHVVEQIFHGMRTADADLVRSLFAPDARFAMLDAREGPPAVRVQGVSGWVDGIARSEGRWDERVYDVVVHVEDAVASVWAPYTFYLDGAVRHCGTNSIELLRDADGWKVTQLSDTRRAEGCPDPIGG